MSTQVIPVAVASPSDGEKTIASTAEPPQPRQSSKAILRKALALANDAVLSDTANNVENAVAAYSEAVRLLDIVLKGMENESDKAKLNEIVCIWCRGREGGGSHRESCQQANAWLCLFVDDLCAAFNIF